MITPISSSSSSVKIAAAGQAPAKQPSKPEPIQVKKEASDVVELSIPAQAKLLKQRGMSIPEIALELKLDVKTVTGYLQMEGAMAQELPRSPR